MNLTCNGSYFANQRENFADMLVFWFCEDHDAPSRCRCLEVDPCDTLGQKNGLYTRN